MVPSFVYAVDRPIDVPGFGLMKVDLVYVGGFFAMVSAETAGIEILNKDHVICTLDQKVRFECEMEVRVE